jgi:putative hydrolase of the HAD superfamily
MSGIRGGGLTWLFDLDNTLHDARPHIFPHLNRSMTQYMMRHLDLDEAGAGALREQYWRRYGATLLGLMRHHGVDPHHFLWHTHQLPELARMIVAERGLRLCLKRLHGRKILFSNSPAHYAQAVLDVLGIGHLFDAVYTIERTRFRPKPALAGFRALMARERLVPERTIMVEDLLDNLVAARKLGMKTAWITRESRRPRWLDAKTSSVLELPRLFNPGHMRGASERSR